MSIPTIRPSEPSIEVASRLRPDILLPHEKKLLLTCARLRLDDGDASRIRILLKQGVEWNHFLRLTVLHCVTAFVFRHFEAGAADLVPKPAMQFLRNRFQQDAADALRNTVHLLELLESFRQQSILAVPYKGPALAVAVYGNVAFRRCNDLDILVSRADVPRARELLEREGFVPLHPITTAGREFLLQKRHSEIFTREHGPIVELHWAFAKQRGIFPLDLDMLRPRLLDVTLFGKPIISFAPDDTLLILCAHGANHLWSRLEWLCGIAELIRSTPLNWSLIMSRARELHSEKALLLGLVLAVDLLDAPVPEDLVARGRGTRDVNWAVNLVKRKFASGQIENPEDRSSIERDLFRLRLQSTNSARMRYLFHRITTPGRGSTRIMLPVGKRFVPLPAFFRPFHLLKKLVANAIPWNRGSDLDPKEPA